MLMNHSRQSADKEESIATAAFPAVASFLYDM
jgi:hypothetical protein